MTIHNQSSYSVLTSIKKYYQSFNHKFLFYTMSQHTASLLDISQIPKFAGFKVAIVYTEWNQNIVTEQIKGVEKIAQELGILISHKIAVPGCVEIPFAARRLFESTQDSHLVPDAIITLGAVI